MLDVIVKLLLLIVLILQATAMVYIMCINHKQEKRDKEFWDDMNKEMQLSHEKLQKCLDEYSEEEIVESEQDK